MTVAIVCESCNTSFTTTNQQARGGRKFCSATCYRAREMINGPRKLVEPVHFTCKQCEGPFQRDPGELASYHKKYGRDPLYCSRACSGTGRRSKPKICKNCGKQILRPDGLEGRTRTVCGQTCRRELKSKQMRALYAGRIPVAHPARNGYMRLVVDGAEILEHRYNMQRHLGRELLPTETVHHIDGDRTNNAVSNLELFSSRHGPGQRVIDKVAFAIEILTIYADFAALEGFRLVKIENAQPDSSCQAAAT